MEKAGALTTEQAVREKKRTIFDRIRYGEPPQAVYMGEYMPDKRGIEDTSYFLEAEQLRSILNISGRGDV